MFVETEAKAVYSRFVDVGIDADSLIYRSCHAGEKEYNMNKIPKEHVLFTEYPLMDMHEQQKEIFHSMISSIVMGIREDLNKKGIDVQDVYLIFTPKKSYCESNGLKENFRYEIVHEFNSRFPDFQHPQYKSGRKGMQLPEGIPEMFEYAMSLDNSIASDHCEADDWLYKWKMFDIEGRVVACLDKDISKGTPSGDIGHFDYNKREWIYTKDHEAMVFFYRQCMMGDSSDTIKGIYRFGEKAAEKLLPDGIGLTLSEEEIWEKVLTTFLEKGYPEEYAILMMRLVNLGQLDDNLKLSLWQPPVITELVDGPKFYPEENNLPTARN